MSRFFSFPAFGFLVAMVLAPYYLGARTLSLQEALVLAREANFELLAESESTMIAKSNLDQRRADGLPQVDLSLSQRRTQFSGAINPLTGLAQSRRADRFEALVRGSLSLLDLERGSAQASLRSDLQAVQLEVEAFAQGVLEGVANAYLGHLRNVRRLEVIDANLERDRVLLKIARDQASAGVATQLDVTRAEVRLAEDELARLQQETVVLESDLRIKRLLNLPLGQEISYIPVELSQSAEGPGFSPEALEDILGRRPDFQAISARVEARTLSLRGAERQRLPQLDLTGEWGYGAEDPSEDLDEEWQIGLQFTVPLFEGFRIRAETQQEEARLRRQRLLADQLALQIEAEFRYALQNLQSRWTQVEVAEKSVALGRRELELSRNRFEEGVADNRDVVDAQARLAAAEDTLVEAGYLYQLSRTALARISGNVLLALEDRPY